ncbi:MAG: hypothetical protein K2O53_05080 [Bacteroidales bacterium]|nr:hypothetical protein [Bacteroidales bacterium]
MRNPKLKTAVCGGLLVLLSFVATDGGLRAQSPATLAPAPVPQAAAPAPQTKPLRARVSRPARWVRYQCELFTGYTMGLGTENDVWVYDRVPLHMLNGMNFGGAFFFGLGVGLNFIGDWSSVDAIRHASKTIPVYLNFKLYLPARESLFKFFVGADMGGIMQDKAQVGGLLLGPMAGLRVRLIGRLGLSFSVSYLYEGWVEGMQNAVSLMYNTHAVSFRAGITF